MTTVKHMRKDLEWAASLALEAAMPMLAGRLSDLARQVEELQADAERYRYLKAYASDSHMWSDESIDSAIARIGK